MPNSDDGESKYVDGVLVVAILIQLFVPALILFVAPRVLRIFAEHAVSLPLPTQVVLDVAESPVLMFLPACLLSAVLIRCKRRRPQLFSGAVAVSASFAGACLIGAAYGLALPFAQI